MHPDEVEPAIRRSLAKLKLDYLDLYLVHWPHAFKRGDEDWPVDANGKALVLFRY
jgi:alcohol dehydrogenase (NADP+)